MGIGLETGRSQVTAGLRPFPSHFYIQHVLTGKKYGSFLISLEFGLEEADFQVVVDMFTNNSTDEVIEILDDIMEIAQKPRLDATEGLYKGFQ